VWLLHLDTPTAVYRAVGPSLSGTGRADARDDRPPVREPVTGGLTAPTSRATPTDTPGTS